MKVSHVRGHVTRLGRGQQSSADSKSGHRIIKNLDGMSCGTIITRVCVFKPDLKNKRKHGKHAI